MTLSFFHHKLLLRFILKNFFIVVGLTSQSPSHAQDSERSISQYVHDVWTAEQGLPQNTVFSIVQSREGYIWFGTFEGLVRFDGLRFTIFDHSNTPEMTDNWITALYEDRDGRLWIGGGSDRAYTPNSSNVGMLLMLQNGKFTSYGIRDGLSNSFINAITEDKDGHLWIGTRNGLLLFNPSLSATPKFTAYFAKDGLPHNYVSSLCPDRTGSLWIGTLGGISEVEMSVDGKINFRSSYFSGPTAIQIHALMQDDSGSLWVGSNKGLFRISRDTRTVSYTVKNGLSHNVVTSLMKDVSGSVWIGTYGGGINRLNPKDPRETFSVYGMKEGLSENIIHCIFEDREGGIWIGTRTGGLNRLRIGKMITYNKKSGMSGDEVNTLIEDSKGILWFGNYNEGGLNRLDNGQFSVLTVTNGMADNNIRSLCESSDGGLWIGTITSGLNYYKNGKFKTYTTKDGLGSNSIASIFEDEGRTWIGTNNGLNLIENGRFSLFKTKDGLCSDLIRILYKDRNGRLWIGTNAGLSLLHHGKLYCFNTTNGLSANLIRSIYEDQDGAIWIGTQGGGLNRIRPDSAFASDPSSLRKEQITSYTVRDGLFDNSVFSILDDDLGYFWMSCNKGIYRVSKQQLKDYDERKIAGLQCTVYGTADGMVNQECNSLAWKARNGWLWFPTVKGAVAVDPKNIKINTIPPPVVIEKIVIDGEMFKPSDNIVIPAGKNNVEFHFTGLSFSATEKVQFKYRLEGFDDDWISAQTRRVAYYTKITDGSHIFHVTACNQDGVWNEIGTSVKVSVLPPFWKARWFQTLLVLTLIGSAFMIYTIRIRSIELEKIKLQKLVNQRTQELQNQTHRLEGALKQLSGAQVQLVQSEKMASLGQMVAGIAHEINNPLSFIYGNLQFMEHAFKKFEAKEASMSDVLDALNGSLNGSTRIKQIVEKLKSFSNTDQAVIKETLINKDLEAILDLFVMHEEHLVIETKFDKQLDTVKTCHNVANINRCFYNVLRNSIQAIREAESTGKLEVGGGKIVITTALVDRHWSVSILDNGIGIAPEIIDKIFDPFFTTRTVGRGEGLGLSEVYGIIKTHGGRIDADSKPGKGTEISMTVPLTVTGS